MACMRPATPATTVADAEFVSTAARSRERLPFTDSPHRQKLQPLLSKEPNMRQLCKGNVAVIKGAVLAGCRAYYGYPITPASEVAEAAALYLPEVGGTFIQAESETASINMVYGAAFARVRGVAGFFWPRVRPVW